MPFHCMGHSALLDPKLSQVTACDMQIFRGFRTGICEMSFFPSRTFEVIDKITLRVVSALFFLGCHGLSLYQQRVLQFLARCVVDVLQNI